MKSTNDCGKLNHCRKSQAAYLQALDNKRLNRSSGKLRNSPRFPTGLLNAKDAPIRLSLTLFMFLQRYGRIEEVERRSECHADEHYGITGTVCHHPHNDRPEGHA